MKKNFDVTGMTCSACSNRVEKAVSHVPGVEDVNVNLLKNSMTVDYDETNTGLEQIIQAVTDAGYTVSTESYGSEEDRGSTLDETVLAEADKLKEGDISGVVETDNGYYVLRLDSEHDEEATASKKEELIAQKKSDHYEDVLSGWRDEAKWELNEKQWEKVTFKDRFTAKAEPEDSTEAVPEEGLDATEGVELK